ncbi:MAG: NAD-dependent epimerase/dehydratase family protein [Nevskia sp.]|nr:NAD-dependent epimerase/dehydratase family protein [Nevskia sp.]
MRANVKILVVGGTGLIGGHLALRLQELGHAVELAARKPPAATTALAKMPFYQVDYIGQEPDRDLLARFDAIVFAAGNDVRHVPAGADADVHWQRANAEAVPRFMAGVKRAGVRHAVLIGSFYPQAAPHLVKKNAYIASRLAADEGTRALASDDFHVVVLNAPFVVGHVPGLVVAGYHAIALWALGRMPQVERYVIPGGLNVISTDTLSDAVAGALARGKSGKAYLIGDENLSFQSLFELFFKAGGDDKPLEVRDQEHPFLPDAVVFAGRGATIYYEPSPDEVSELRYRRNDVARTVKLIVDAAR